MFGQLITLWQSKYTEIDNSHIVNATINYLLLVDLMAHFFNLQNNLVLIILMAD